MLTSSITVANRVACPAAGPHGPKVGVLVCVSSTILALVCYGRRTDHVAYAKLEFQNQPGMHWIFSENRSPYNLSLD
jgi:hypothetical protein